MVQFYYIEYDENRRQMINLKEIVSVTQDNNIVVLKTIDGQTFKEVLVDSKEAETFLTYICLSLTENRPVISKKIFEKVKDQLVVDTSEDEEEL